jgi:hypothetical protein
MSSVAASTNVFVRVQLVVVVAAAALVLMESPRLASRTGGVVVGNELEGQADMQNCFSSRQSSPY